MGACTLTKIYRWAPPTPCDTPTVRKALLVIKSHPRRISTKTNFIVMELLIKNTWKHKRLQVLVFKVLTCTQSHRLLCDHIYMYMLNVEVLRPHTCTNSLCAGLSLPSSMSKLIRKVAGHVILSNCSLKWMMSGHSTWNCTTLNTSPSHIDIPLSYTCNTFT